MPAAAPFFRWWKDPIKHYKRRHYWIPEAKRLHRELQGTRHLRYFTLCSREMIDVFSFIKEKVISYDSALHKINHVKFCENRPDIFPEVKEMIGYEDSGFLGRLQDIALFKGDPYTDKFTSKRDIDAELERLGEDIGKEKKQRLALKLDYLRLQEAFPFDFLNLDFCDVYYPNPPNTMQINSTISQLVEWQGRLGVDNGQQFSLRRFLLAVTCRFDDTVSNDAYNRMATVLAGNQREYPQYRIALERRPLGNNLRQWRRKNPLDFFLSAWPKELLQIMERHQWRMEIRGFVFYFRVGESGKRYIIVSLLCDCVRQSSLGTHEKQSLWLLDNNNREKLEPPSRSSPVGRSLYGHLKAVVVLRNAQARFCSRPLLPPI